MSTILKYGADTITLRDVSLGDTLSTMLIRSENHTIHKAMQLYRDPYWPIENKVKWTIREVDYTRIKAYWDFINNHIGQLLEVTHYYRKDIDPDSVLFSIIILAVDNIVQNGIHNYELGFTAVKIEIPT